MVICLIINPLRLAIVSCELVNLIAGNSRENQSLKFIAEPSCCFYDGNSINKGCSD